MGSIFLSCSATEVDAAALTTPPLVAAAALETAEAAVTALESAEAAATALESAEAAAAAFESVEAGGVPATAGTFVLAAATNRTKKITCISSNRYGRMSCTDLWPISV